MVSSDPDARLRTLLAPGSLFEDKYRVVSELGTGSFAIVAKAKHEVMGRDVALKCLKPSVVRSNPEVSERFVNEVQIVSRLRHPNTVTIFDFGQTDQRLAYMVLEYLEGETLDEAIARNGALDEARAIHICRQILKSLAEAHALGIVHRDLKPSNIMLTELHGEPDFVKVLDFGVAKLLEDSDQQDDKFQPRSTQFIGTPVYMSPEQVLGQPVTPASDLYSLGLILYEMLTGETPIEHESVASVVREHLDDSPLPFPALDRISEPIQQLILKCTARQPAARFGSVRQFARALPADGAADSIERARPRLASQEDEPPAGLDEESAESDIFSGKNYIAPPEIEEEAPAAASAELVAPRPSLQRGQRNQRNQRNRRDQRARQNRPDQRDRRNQRTQRPANRAPSLRTDELDLDLESIDRQRRRVEHRRQRHRGSRERRVDGDWEAREYWTRSLVYLAGLAAAHWGFVVLTAMMPEQSGAARFGAGVLIFVAAAMWTNFSSVKAVGADLGRRWLMPTAKNLIYITALIAAAATLWRPAETAEALLDQPTWFYRGMPSVPPISWLDGATVWGASKLAAFFTYVADLLPY